MNPILIDTSAYSAFKREQPEAMTILSRAPTIGMSIVVIGELLGGFALSSREEDNVRELARFLALPYVTLLPADRQTAEHYARIYVTLRKAGSPIPTNDMWIAATAMQHGLDVFSYDRHFAAVENLHVVNLRSV